MKKFIRESFVIILASLALGMSTNYLHKNPLYLFKPLPPPAGQNSASGQSAEFQEVDSEMLSQLFSTDRAIILDARKPDLFKSGHIPGAWSLPAITFEQSFAGMKGNFQKGKTLILYCIAIDCHDSEYLALKLSEKGLTDILIYRGGMKDWVEKGNTVETGE